MIEALRYSPVIRLAALVMVGLVLGGLTLRWSAFRPGRWARRLFKTGVTAGSLFLALSVAELGLYLFHAETSGQGDTLASRRWMAMHWHPLNSLGYRDTEPPTYTDDGHKVVAVVGDSFAAGYGIARIEDRVGGVLSELLGRDWRVVTLAQPGWGTASELAALRDYPGRLDAVVLVYYVNDVEEAARRSGLPPPHRGGSKPVWLRSWINRSYVFNLAYSRWSGWANLERARAYWAYLRTCFADPRVWAAHEEELGAIVSRCRRDDLELFALVIPNLRAVEESAPLTGKVATFLRGLEVEVVDLGEHLTGRRGDDLVVSTTDAHANAALHREMAEHVYQAMNATWPSMRLSEVSLAHDASSH